MSTPFEVGERRCGPPAADLDPDWAGYEAPGGADDEPRLLFPGGRLGPPGAPPSDAPSPGRPSSARRPSRARRRAAKNGGVAPFTLLQIFDDSCGVDGRWAVAGAAPDEFTAKASARAVMSAAALRLGVGAEYVSSLSLYAFSRDGCDRRIDPATPAGALKKCDALVLAVRLAVAASWRASALPPGRPRRAPGSTAVRLGALRLWSRARDLAAKKQCATAAADVVRPLAITLLATHGAEARARGRQGRGGAGGPRDLERRNARQRARRRRSAQLERQGIEIEIVESVEDVQYFNDGAKPESDFLELVSSLPLYGAALFPLRGAARGGGRAPRRDDDAPKSAVANRVLAISREGAAVLTADLRTELQLIPMNKLRRWHAALDAICFEVREALRPLEPELPAAAVRRRRDPGEAETIAAPRGDGAGQGPGRASARRREARAPGATAKARPKSWTSWATALLGGAEAKSEREKPLPPPPASLSDEEDESSDSDLEAPMQRVRFELLLVERPGQVGYRSREIVDLLDDYSVFDLVEDRPRCQYQGRTRERNSKLQSLISRPFSTRQYHSIFGTGLPMNGTSRVARATVGTSEQMASEGGGALGDQPTVYNALVSAVVRPPRFLYDARLLGPSSFEFGGKRFFRHDLVIRNQHGLRLHCSHWRPAAPEHQRAAARPCVVFMHANSASRIQACSYLPVALSLGCSMFAFDCCGSGVSDGTYVSLGYHEADDLLVALTHLRKRKDTGPLVVWGHSMGAASVIYYQGRYRGSYPRIDAAVLDSPYADFEELANHLVKQNSAVATGSLGKYVVGFSLTRMALNLVLESIDASCLQLAKFSPLKDLSPISHAATCVTPALFMQARSDRIIALSHVEGLANRYGGTRKLAIVDGTHSSPRNGAARHFIAMYLKKNVKLPPEAARPDTRNRDRYLELSPWHRPRSALPPCT
ncbi:palmitoyl-(protein) hydrolase [Aureococcus anophagefferens]|uniref:Palmitoyl-(Protein) hydrolase n=1 Tax=Aureococcus anophagefferens TaxID=44056 RepID=A0ABR1G9D5_AURAN